MKRFVVLVLACMLLLSACGAQPKSEPTPEPTPDPVAGVDFAPDTGTADRSNLPYLSAIESSRNCYQFRLLSYTIKCNNN